MGAQVSPACGGHDACSAGVSRRCCSDRWKADSGDLGALEADVDVSPELTNPPLPARSRPSGLSSRSRSREACASTELAGEAGAAPKADLPDDCHEPHSSAGSEVGASSGTDCSSASFHFRGNKRHAQRRLLVTHTMEMRPSNALQLIIENSGDIASIYRFRKKPLGKGAFGVVRKGVLRATGAPRAVKEVAKEQMKTSMHQLRNEMEIMKQIDHPNLIMLHEIFEDENSIYLVMELCEGGDLYDRLSKAGHLSEVMAACAMNQIFRAVFYLHSNSICHRDLKAANCLLSSPAPLDRCKLKVSDFGLSYRLEPAQVLVSAVGTPTHMAPEVYAKKYSWPCDLWSCGVILYELLCGELPFWGKTREELGAAISTCSVNFGMVEWLDISQPACDLVTVLLARDPKARCTPSQALAHKWLQEKVPKPDSARLPEDIIENLRRFRKHNKLKRAALHVLASMVPEKEIIDARDAFIVLDANGDGLFSIAELQDHLKRLHGAASRNRHKKKAKEVFKDIDEDGDLKEFTYTEFLAATFRKTAVEHEKLLQAAFSSFDKNGDGKVSISELATGRLLGKLNLDDLTDALDEIDADGDNNMDFTEFMRMMHTRSEGAARDALQEMDAKAGEDVWAALPDKKATAKKTLAIS